MQTGTNRYLYNGKELQQMASLDFLDYGARMYDGYSGRWFNIDPLAHKYYWISPFAYAANNPIRFFDPDGRSVKPADEQALEAIKNTLRKKERKYVQLNGGNHKKKQ